MILHPYIVGNFSCKFNDGRENKLGLLSSAVGDELYVEKESGH